MSILDEIKGGLIVSCQALEDEPFHGRLLYCSGRNERGVHAAVIGSAITRPMLITKRFVSAIKGE